VFTYWFGRAILLSRRLLVEVKFLAKRVSTQERGALAFGEVGTIPFWALILGGYYFW